MFTGHVFLDTQYVLQIFTNFAKIILQPVFFQKLKKFLDPGSKSFSFRFLSHFPNLNLLFSFFLGNSLVWFATIQIEPHILDLTNIKVNFDLDNSKMKKTIIQGSLNVSMANHYSNPTQDKIIYLMLLACHRKSYLICLEFSKFHVIFFFQHTKLRVKTANRADTAV